MTDKKEIHTYQAEWNIYGMGISEKPDSCFRFALGSFIEDYANKIEIVQLDIDTGTFTKKAMVDHPYPSTKIMWIPDRQGTLPDLFATTGDYLRVWAVTDTAKGPCEVNLRQFLNNNKNSEYCAPLTAFDWNDADPNIIGTASIDTTCTIWDLSTGQAKTQLIAHDKEVYDIAFASRSVFGSVGAEGSVRLFDLRSLEHSTIIYETGQGTDSQKPLLRLAWNKSDPNFIATVPLDSDEVRVSVIFSRASRRLLFHCCNPHPLAGYRARHSRPHRPRRTAERARRQH
jgi:WD repeat-containing protein 68